LNFTLNEFNKHYEFQLAVLPKKIENYFSSIRVQIGAEAGIATKDIFEQSAKLSKKINEDLEKTNCMPAKNKSNMQLVT
jgi:hypothetical protein